MLIKDEREEKNKFEIWSNYFKKCEYNPGFKGIDLELKYHHEPIIWCEAKKKPTRIDVMFAQLIFTIYKVQKEYEAPRFLSVFDNEKIAFIPFSAIEILYNEYKTADFNWKVRPSDTTTKEFKKISHLIKGAIERKEVLYESDNLYDFKQLVFYFKKDKTELKEWIDRNIYSVGPSEAKQITSDNFNKVYNRWRDEVKISIDADWDAIRQSYNILDGDFFLADLMSVDNDTATINDKLYILLESDYYKIQKEGPDANIGLIAEIKVNFIDNQSAHCQFWNRYKRPPSEQYWDLILKRRDLLVPLDIRERLGAFFTPSMWVRKAQECMSSAWGDLDDYFIWDCAGGTGNLMEGLTNKSKLYISDINIENVYITRGRVQQNELNLYEDNCFQFDFLNDDFSKLPLKLQNVIRKDPKNLIIFMNPPYVESAGMRVVQGKAGRKNIGKTKIRDDYKKELGAASKEVFAQFLARIYFEIPNCKIGHFSKLKHIQGTNFKQFRQFFKAHFEKGFLIPAWTFDNVKGQFPIAFQCWNTAIKDEIKDYKFDVYFAKKDNKEIFKEIKDVKKLNDKKVYCYDQYSRINDWLSDNYDNENDIIAWGYKGGNDFQHTNFVNIHSGVESYKTTSYKITKDNLISSCIYLSVQKIVKPTWLNDRDQFLHPNDGWIKDKEFKNDCLAYALFHNANNVQAKYGINHWIPFTEEEVEARKPFDSNFMSDFIAGKIHIDNGNGVFKNGTIPSPKREFSKEATAVFDAGRELWKYYHSVANDNPFSRSKYNANASLYDIREYFQGRKNNRMLTKSDDEHYKDLLNNLKKTLDILASKIEPKVYQYGFLLE
ncbi:MAG: hypothetical protein FWG85_00200 [Bacteroidetes bacterium]|nr:hypothetical protein [Bacteroidota bacterium]